MKKYVYRVTRHETVVYIVESDEPLEKPEHIYGQLMHPHNHWIERENIQQLKP